MNGWSPDDIHRIEEDAAKINSLWNRAGHLHRETGLGWHICIVWAQIIRKKYNLTNGEPDETRLR